MERVLLGQNDERLMNILDTSIEEIREFVRLHYFIFRAEEHHLRYHLIWRGLI